MRKRLCSLPHSFHSIYLTCLLFSLPNLLNFFNRLIYLISSRYIFSSIYSTLFTYQISTSNLLKSYLIYIIVTYL
uniref:Putative ovule protein n=1 Tax=Solanum chacoense TaxID=4108 RepID=A0A0V0HU95_SOLCH